ncbi:MAG: DUF4440 domain-containing protein [Saprospiraceae bacterium]|nr:DUF4440 domain-containing protein [Saprospiraceae bacterium]
MFKSKLSNNRNYISIALYGLLTVACKPNVNKDKVIAEIMQVEKEFQQMTVEKSITEAFYYFADDDAVIKREHDTLISGKSNIRKYYESKKIEGASVEWAPDFVDVSKCGHMAYTYGSYLWKVKDSNDSTREYKGIFHTIWKKQPDHSWKYVWD